MNSEFFSILANALERAAEQGKTPCKPHKTSIFDKKVIDHLRRSSQYQNYVKEHLIDDIGIIMNNNKDFVHREIANLSTLETKELRRLWEEHFKNPPPPNAKKKTLIENLAYSIREKAFGGLSKSAKEKLEIYKERYKKGESILGHSQNYELIPGMILSREYNHTTHIVKILEDAKVEYNGKIYNSLSAVAREITGIRWNGPKFFHLVKR
jgi:hypothetical protein